MGGRGVGKGVEEDVGGRGVGEGVEEDDVGGRGDGEGEGDDGESGREVVVEEGLKNDVVGRWDGDDGVAVVEGRCCVAWSTS